tara:strand:+ start:338 stop:541 length:204 start_codon:yes stop_codon:yes gene_type:complete
VTELTGCKINIEGGDGKFNLSVIGDVFEGLNAVNRQKMIYKILNAQIQSGDIHAVTMQLQTVAESGA